MSQIRTNSIVPAGGVPAGAAGGGVIQTVTANKTNAFTSTATYTWTDITGMSASITPRKSTNKIAIFWNVQHCHGAAPPHYRLERNGTAIGIGDQGGTGQLRVTAIRDPAGGSSYVSTLAGNYIDSPGTTSSVTYNLASYIVSGTLYINRSETQQTEVGYGRGNCTLTLMEISG